MQKSTERSKTLIIALLLLVFGGSIGFRLGQGEKIPVLSMFIKAPRVSDAQAVYTVKNTKQQGAHREIDFQLFWKVWDVLEKNYVDPEKLKQDQMVYGAIAGMTSALGDPYTVFLPPVQQKRSEEDLGGAFYGVGIQLGYIDTVLAVSAPLKGSPAEKAGVKAKDLILHVTDKQKGIDKDTQGWSLQEAVDVIRGERGTEVVLTLMRKDEKKEPFQVTLKRDEIVIPSVEVKFIEKQGKKVADITLSKFGDRTDEELNKVIAEIKQQAKVDGIVLDLRNNPGGYLDGAISVASEFIKSGLIVSQKGKFSSKDYNALQGKARLAEYPVVVAVNGGSASAAEIVAGALKDRRDAKLVGEKTFGKGTVQDAIKLDDGAGLHVTIAKWMMPQGEWIHETGIPATIEVKDNPDTTDVDEVIQRAADEVLK